MDKQEKEQLLKQYIDNIRAKMINLSAVDALERTITLLAEVQVWSDNFGPFLNGPMFDLKLMSLDEKEEINDLWFEERKMNRKQFIRLIASDSDGYLTSQFRQFKNQYFPYTGSYCDLTGGEEPTADDWGDEPWELLGQDNGFWCEFTLTPKRQDGRITFACELSNNSNEEKFDDDVEAALTEAVMELFSRDGRDGKDVDYATKRDNFLDTDDYPDDDLPDCEQIVYVVFTQDGEIASDHYNGIDCMYTDEDDAQSALEQYRSDSNYRDGYPWMFYATWCPDSGIDNETLLNNGFSVGIFKKTGKRYCGFDGSGQWDEQHFIPVFVEYFLDKSYYARREKWPKIKGFTAVMTDSKGLIYVEDAKKN